jgi:dinuclear metal center YbgI/SA1388 family protein
MKIKTLLNYLEEIAPPQYQEGYDNSGLIVGDPGEEAKGAVICLDSTEAVVEEAHRVGANLIIAHHPIVFKGLKRLTGRNYVERTVIKAIRYGIAIYAIHTNLDNVYSRGVNAKIAERLGLENTRILAPKREMQQLRLSIPAQEAPALRAAFSELEEDIELQLPGGENGTANVQALIRFESGRMPLDRRLLNEKAGWNGEGSLSLLQNPSPLVGSGMIGDLPEAMDENAFLKHIKERMQVSVIRHTALQGKQVSRVALCGGAGGFLLSHAIRQGADFFITADYKYHEFFDADGRIVIADIGHFESEQFTIDLIYQLIKNKFRNFAVRCTEEVTNPVKYYYS